MRKAVKDKLVHLVVLYNEIDVLRTRCVWPNEGRRPTCGKEAQDKRISNAIDILTERVKEIKEELIKLPESDDNV